MMKIIKRISLLFLIVITCLILAPSNKCSIEVNAFEEKLEVTIYPTNDINGYAFPNAAGAVYFTVGISMPIENDVTIYYKTKDKSAIASLGDYTPKESSVKIPQGEMFANIVVYTERAEYAVQSPEGKIYSREFEVEITEVVGISDFNYSRKSAKGMIGYNYVYKAKRNNESHAPYNSLYFEEYENIDISPSLSTEEIDGEGVASVKYNFSSNPLYSHWKKNYIDSNLADLYTTFKGVIDDLGYFTYWSYEELYDSQQRLIFGVQTEGYYDYEDLNPQNAYHTGYSMYHQKYFGPGTDKEQNHYVDEVCCICKDQFSTSNINYHSYFYRINGAPDYTLTLRSEGGWDRQLLDAHIYTTMIDTDAAYVEEEKFYASSLENVGDKLRISIRFNEPVYVKEDIFKEVGSKGSSITIYPNGNSNYPVVLNYAGGSYTDTLYYEVEYENINLPYDKISYFVYGGGSGTVCDFAYTTAKTGKYPHHQNNNKSLADLKISNKIELEADLRIPVIEFELENENTILKQHSVTVSVSNIDLEDSKLYYSWEETDTNIGTEIKNKNYHGTAMDTNTIIGGGYSGNRYLHVYVETKYGKNKYEIYDTALGFDNKAPTVTVDSVTGGYKSRVYNITVSDNFTNSNSGLKAVYMYYRKEIDFDFTTIQIKTYGKNVYDDTFSYEVTATDLGISKLGYSYIDLGFYAIDNLGNKIQIDYFNESETYLFDNSNSMICLYEMINEDKGHKMLYTDYFETFVVKKNPNEDLHISFRNYDIISELKGNTPILEGVYEVSTGRKIATDTFSNEDDPSLVTLVLNPTDSNGEFLPGYYKFKFYTELSGGTFYSHDFYIYLTEDKETDVTPNYSQLDKQYVLNNYVYQLSLKYPNYYYLDTVGTLQKVPYATASTAATFSSYDRAYQYVYTKELLDLYGKKITELEALYLNSGTIGTHTKAEGETTVAKEGQIWIRYKRASWDYIDQETSWVWYCYDETTTSPTDFTIDVTVGILPDLLVDALNTVSTKITKNGNYTYLVGAEHIDKYGAPKLNSNQIHIKQEYYFQTNCGTEFGFGSYVCYSGDPNIVKSFITYNNEKHYLATNFILVSEQYLVLYYRPSGSNDDYQELAYKAGMTYAEAIAANGLFDILEVGTNGVKEYKVYIDRQAPQVELSYVDSLGINKQIVLSHESSGTNINARTISIDRIISEVDNLAYMLLYKTSNLKLIDVITKEDLELGSYILENDHYSLYVYDRSGNYYVVNIRTNDSSLICNIREQENEYIVIETNRESYQIQYFEVYLDGELVTNTYSPSLRLTKSGFYKINVKDWYGNIETIEYSFDLSLPTVEWKYEEDGVLYNDTHEGIKIQQLSENDYFIVSKGLLQFTLKSGYGYEFIGETPEHSHSYINNRVKFKEVKMFTVKIFYTTNPHVYVTYNVSFDEIAPEINATYLEKEYNYEELKYFTENLKDYESNQILIPNELKTSINSSKYNKIVNGEVIDSDLISIKFSDSSGLYNIKVYLEGKLIEELIYGQDMNEISLSERGIYKIIATDVLGNAREFNFTNKHDMNHQFEINSIDSTLKDYLLYGNESIRVKLQKDGEISYLIKSEGKTYYISLKVKDGVIYRSYYFKGVDEYLNSILCVDDTAALFKISEENKPNVYYDLVSEGLLFKVMYDQNNNFVIDASLIDDKVYDFECRVVANNDDPFIYRGSLSTSQSDIILKDFKGELLNTEVEGKYIYTSKEFIIDKTQQFEDIKYIRVNYSLDGSTGSTQYIYGDGELKVSKFTLDGFYKIEIINIYGNITTYNLAMSNTFITTSKVVDKLGNEYIYSKDYNDKLYSNNNILINAYSNKLSYQVLKDGIEYNPLVTEENGQTTVVLSAQGDYIVSFVDEYGNEKVFTAEIKTVNLLFDEELIYGYSKNAKEGFTNKKLSIDYSLFDEYGISYVSVIFQDKETVIFDLINEEKVEFDLKHFEECIGFDNQVGKYIIVFKDKYGNEMRKTVDYSDTPTLNLSRTTRSDQEKTYDLETALVDGFWSNMKLKFTSVSTNYTFKVNGETLHLPYTLSFDNDTLGSEIKYSIYYLDEYGYEFEFNAYLCRKDVEVEVLNTDIVIIGDTQTTKTNIKLKVEDNAIVTYTINGANPIIYNGEELYKDGLYRIEVVDLAGNKEAVEIKKDTYVYYQFYNVGKGENIINGEVVNSKQVNFKVTNDDTSYIEKVFLDGVLLEKYDSNTFSQNGKWEFIISDKIGNKSYFSFYQIIKTMKSFDYKTPDYYKISEIQYVSLNGITISYMDFVEQYEINSKVSLTENGTYKIKITSTIDYSSKTFEINVDNTAPNISLIGCEIGGSTKEDVTLDGYEVGDTIYIYKDGKLVSKTYVSSKSITPPIIKDGGEYKIIVESEAGVTTTIQFTKTYITNTAGSVLISIIILSTVTCLFAGLILRNKLKVDK